MIAIVGNHHVADGVVALNILDSLAVEQEVLANHLHIAEPVSPVLADAAVLIFHNKGRRRIIHAVFACNCCANVVYFLLAGHVADDHLLDNLTAAFRVCVHAIGALFLHEGVPTVVELGDVSAIVFYHREFASWVLSFIAVRVQYQIV